MGSMIFPFPGDISWTCTCRSTTVSSPKSPGQEVPCDPEAYDELTILLGLTAVLHSKLGAATAFPVPTGLTVNEIGGSLIMSVMTVSRRSVPDDGPQPYFSRPVLSVLSIWTRVFHANGLPQDSSLCLSVIAAWKAFQFLGGQIDPFPHLFYESQALQSLRRKILAEGQAAVTDEAILAASLLWATSTMFGQPEALRRHATGMSALVKARGGFNAIGKASSIGQAASIKQLILWADFLTAQLLGDRVFFSDIGPKVPMPLSLVKLAQTMEWPPPWTVLGTETMEAAREMKLLLVSHDTATRTGRVSISEYKALTSLLNRSTIARIDLDCRLKNSGSIDECVIIALNILRLMILFHAGPLISLMVSVISRLRQALKRATLDLFLTANPSCIDIYIWASFVGLVNPFESENRSYFIEMLGNGLRAKYQDSDWPSNWRTQTLNMLRSFLWSDSVLTKLYFDTCPMVEAQNLTPTSQQSAWSSSPDHVYEIQSQGQSSYGSLSSRGS